jgi:hypothetical protein
MCGKEPEKTSEFRQFGVQPEIIPYKPAVKSPIPMYILNNAETVLG